MAGHEGLKLVAATPEVDLKAGWKAWLLTQAGLGENDLDDPIVTRLISLRCPSPETLGFYTPDEFDALWMQNGDPLHNLNDPVPPRDRARLVHEVALRCTKAERLLAVELAAAQFQPAPASAPAPIPAPVPSAPAPSAASAWPTQAAGYDFISSLQNLALGRQPRAESGLFGGLHDDENAPVFDLGRFLEDYRSHSAELQDLDVAWFPEPKSLAIMDKELQKARLGPAVSLVPLEKTYDHYPPSTPPLGRLR